MIFGESQENIVKLAVEHQSEMVDGVAQYDYKEGEVFGASFSSNETENPNNPVIEVFRIKQGGNPILFANADECGSCELFEGDKTADELPPVCVDCCIDAYIGDGFEADFESFRENLEGDIRDIISEIVSDDLALLDEIRLAIIERDDTYAEYVNAVMNNTYEMDILDYLVEGALEWGFSTQIASKDYLEGELIHLGETCDYHIDNHDNMEFWADVQEKLREFDLKGVLKLLQ